MAMMFRLKFKFFIGIIVNCKMSLNNNEKEYHCLPSALFHPRGKRNLL